MYRIFDVLTVVCLIIVQDRINLLVGKFPKIDKCAGWNKAVQARNFQKFSTIKSIFFGQFFKIDKLGG